MSLIKLSLENKSLTKIETKRGSDCTFQGNVKSYATLVAVITWCRVQFEINFQTNAI